MRHFTANDFGVGHGESLDHTIVIALHTILYVCIVRSAGMPMHVVSALVMGVGGRESGRGRAINSPYFQAKIRKKFGQKFSDVNL